MFTGCMLTLLGFFGFLRLCGAHGINCTVSQDADETTYSISSVPHVSHDSAADCDYSWTRTGNYVLANNMEENTSLVRRNSIHSLVISACFNKVDYTRRCVSEGTEYNSECTFVCRGSALLQEETGRDEQNVVSKNNGSCPWIAAVIILLVLTGVVGFYCRDKILKKACSCNGGIHMGIECVA